MHKKLTPISFRVCCFMGHQVQEKLCSLEQWLIILIAPLYECLVRSWFRNTSEKALEWFVNFSLWLGMLRYMLMPSSLTVDYFVFYGSFSLVDNLSFLTVTLDMCMNSCIIYFLAFAVCISICYFAYVRCYSSLKTLIATISKEMT